MGAPADLVRAQYCDIDHHIRHDAHPNITYRWESAAPGERKIRTTFRILGVPQYDVSRLEDAPDGSFLIRYLEGTNAGTMLGHEFIALDDGSTEVRITADAPATLARKLLGPLFRAGARRIMKKTLEEDKRDIEKGHYRPGIAAGDLGRSLAPLGRGAKGRSPAAARAIMLAAHLTAAADASVDDAERDALGSIATRLGLDPTWATQTEADVGRFASNGRLALRAEEIGLELVRCGIAEEGLVAAAVAGFVSHGLSAREHEALGAIAASAGFSLEALADIIERTDAALMAW